MAWLKRAVLVAVVGTGVCLHQLWQPMRQVELHTVNLLRRISDRDWEKVQAMLSPDFRDSWGHDRSAAMDKAREAGSHFFALHVMTEEPRMVTVQGDEATALLRPAVYGSGTAVAQAIMDAVRAETEPVVLRWKRTGAWPWQWQLVTASHEGLAEKYRW